jgi:hypothetical protein
MEYTGEGAIQPDQVTYVLYTRTRWNEPQRARHQVAFELSKRHRTYFIEANKIGFPELRRFKINDKLTVLTPYWPIDYRIRYRIEIFNKIYQKYILNEMDKILKLKSNIRVINFDHTATEIHKKYGNIIYYCNDYYQKTRNHPVVLKYFNNSERIVSTNAKFCVATSDQIKNHLKKNNPNVYLIKLGAPKLNIDSIKINYKYETKKITVILLGYIYANKTSIDLLQRINEDKQIKMTIVGIVEKKILKKIKNVKHKKPLIGGPLIDEINKNEIGIAPYDFHEDNFGRTPNKLWYYLALGKPVVVSDLPSLKKWKFPQKTVYMGKNIDEFVENIKKAHFENNINSIKKRILFAQKNTWEKRIMQLYKLYQMESKRKMIK